MITLHLYNDGVFRYNSRTQELSCETPFVLHDIGNDHYVAALKPANPMYDTATMVTKKRRPGNYNVVVHNGIGVQSGNIIQHFGSVGGDMINSSIGGDMSDGSIWMQRRSCGKHTHANTTTVEDATKDGDDDDKCKRVWKMYGDVVQLYVNNEASFRGELNHLQLLVVNDNATVTLFGTLQEETLKIVSMMDTVVSLRDVHTHLAMPEDCKVQVTALDNSVVRILAEMVGELTATSNAHIQCYGKRREVKPTTTDNATISFSE
jgi:hypothetical protein